jgi:hypothetical protein
MDLKDAIIDFDNPNQSALALKVFRSLSGVHRVNVVRYRARRSDRQNRYYWPAFVHAFGDYLREQGEEYTDDEVHEFFKAKFLRRPVIDKNTGEVLGQAIASTTTLSTTEFNEYLDKVAAWLWHKVGIAVPPPEQYREREAA